MKGGKAMYSKQEEAPTLADSVQLLMWFPYGQYHFAVRADSDIQTLDDLEGASVFLGPTGGGAWNAAYGWVKATTGLDAKEGDFEAIDAQLDHRLPVLPRRPRSTCTLPVVSIRAVHSCRSPRRKSIRFVGPEDSTGEAVEKYLGKFRLPRRNPGWCLQQPSQRQRSDFLEHCCWYRCKLERFRGHSLRDHQGVLGRTSIR